MQTRGSYKTREDRSPPDDDTDGEDSSDNDHRRRDKDKKRYPRRKDDSSPSDDDDDGSNDGSSCHGVVLDSSLRVVVLVACYKPKFLIIYLFTLLQSTRVLRHPIADQLFST